MRFDKSPLDMATTRYEVWTWNTSPDWLTENMGDAAMQIAADLTFEDAECLVGRLCRICNPNVATVPAGEAYTAQTECTDRFRVEWDYGDGKSDGPGPNNFLSGATYTLDQLAKRMKELREGDAENIRVHLA